MSIIFHLKDFNVKINLELRKETGIVSKRQPDLGANNITNRFSTQQNIEQSEAGFSWLPNNNLYSTLNSKHINEYIINLKKTPQNLRKLIVLDLGQSQTMRLG